MMGFMKTSSFVSRHKLVGSIIFLGALSTSSYSYTFTPEVGVNVEQHSNIAKDATNQEDTTVSPYFGFNFRETNSTLDAHIDFLVTHEEYVDDTFSSLDLFDITAFADWSIVPQRFVWAFDDYATTQQISAIDASNPDNLQTVNVFSTGPDLILSEGVWSALGKLRLGSTTYSESGEDSIFYGGSFAVTREINEYSRVATGVIYRTNDFDEEGLSDYDVGKVFAEYSRDLPAGKLLTGIGASYADINNEKDDTLPYFKLLLSYTPTGFFTIDLSAVNEFSDDAGRAYDATASRQVSQNNEVGSTLAGTRQPGVYRSRNLSLAGRYTTSLVSFALRGFYTEESFVEGGRFDVEAGTGFDTEEAGIAANMTRLLSERMALNIGGMYKETDYPQQNFTDEELNASASLDYRISRKLFIGVGVLREERKSNVATREFDDDVIFFSLAYKGGAK